MRTKRLLLVSGFGLVITLGLLLRLDQVQDAVTALFQPALYQRIDPIRSFCYSANLAKQCLANEYTPELIVAIAPLYTESNPNRANELLNRALSETALGISDHSVFDIYLELSAVRVKQKRYSEAENYVQSAMKLRCSDLQRYSPDDKISCLWQLSDLEKAQRHFDKADSYISNAIEESHASLSPLMQETLALLLEKKAELKTVQNASAEAEELRRRAHLARESQRSNSISPIELPFIKAAKAKYEKALADAGISPEEDEEQVASAPRPVASKQLMSELRNIRFPTMCRLTDTELRQEADKLPGPPPMNKVVDCSPFGPVAGPREFDDSGCFVVNEAGELFTFNTHYQTASVTKNNERESFQCETPQVWWACAGMNIDRKNNRLIAVSNEQFGVTLFEKPLNSTQPWSAIASLSNSGVKNACGLFYGPNNELYTLDRDYNQRITAIVRLSNDGIVRKITNLPSPLPTSSELNFGIVRRNDKIVLVQPEQQGETNENGELVSSGGSWVLDFKGNILAWVPFDSPVKVSSAVPN